MSDVLAQFKETYPVIQEADVQWGDMDALSHVNNVTYFRYFENVRIHYMGKTSMIKDPEMGPVLGATECRYRRPLTFPDRILVGARVSEVNDFGCLQEYAVYSQSQDAITTTGSARIVMVNARTGQKTELTGALREEIEALEGRSF